jgi:hypothetical protein
MFFLLRVGLVVAAIFYFSPVRKAGIGTGPGSLPAVRSSAAEHVSARAASDAAPGAPKPATGAGPAGAVPDAIGEAERLWSSLPRGAQLAVLDRLRAEIAEALDAASSAEPARAAERHLPQRIEEPPRRP